MATLRKRFVTIETRLLWEPWPDEIKLALIRLSAHMVERWAADGLSFEAASTVFLSPHQLMEIMGAGRIDRAEHRLGVLRTLVSISVGRCTQHSGKRSSEFYRISWPKWAQIQSSGRQRRAEARVSGYPLSPASAVEGTRREKEQEEKPSESAAKAADAHGAKSSSPRWKGLARMLSMKGVIPEMLEDERTAWFEAIEPELEAAAELDAAAKVAKPNKTHVTAAFKRVMFARWRAYLRSDRLYRGQAERDRLTKAKLAWEAEHGADVRALDGQA